MEPNGGVEEVATDNKRPREGNDGAAVLDSDVFPEQVNGALADLEKLDVKKAKIDGSASGASVMYVEEEQKDLESEILETIVAKDGSGAKKARVAEAKKGKNMPGGGREGKKRKVAVLLAYSGAGYQGMQRNPEAITIKANRSKHCSKRMLLRSAILAT